MIELELKLFEIGWKQSEVAMNYTAEEIEAAEKSLLDKIPQMFELAAKKAEDVKKKDKKEVKKKK